jgi:hypothetical protein
LEERPRKYRCKLETEELDSDSDCEVQFASDDSDNDLHRLFLKIAMVLLQQMRNGRREDEKTRLHCIISLILILD